MGYYFPFGQPVLKQEPTPSKGKKIFILGAYPSALHVAWQPPAPYRKIRALAVDNEPEVFWCGYDEETLINKWIDTVGFDSCFGNITSAGTLNGSSGRWVNVNILTPFAITREESLLTDCLKTYRASKGVAARIKDTYSPFSVEYGLPPAKLMPHPNEDEIVLEALVERARLFQKIENMHPSMIITLGNAALRVLGHLVSLSSEKVPDRLSANPQLYGKPIKIDIGNISGAEWWPLAHPASPPAYQEAHKHWMIARK